MNEVRCAHCGERIEGEPIQRGSLVYCTDACAFEATRSKDCGGRTDSVSAPPVIEYPTDRDAG
jgi:hypothetical protein